MNTPKLSIITVCFNEKNIATTCESVVRQTWQNFEWLIIDGGSTDGTLDTLEQYRDHISVFISEKDKGIYNAMNKGIAHAKGEYVIFLNGGDYFLDPFSLERLFTYEDWQEDIVCCDALFLKEGGIPLLKEFGKAFPLKPEFFISDSFAHQATIIRRDLFTRYGSYNENRRIVSDWEKWIEFIVVHHASCRHFDRILSIHNYTGISSHDTPEHRNERLDVLRQYYPELFAPGGELSDTPSTHKKQAVTVSTVTLFNFLPLLRITQSADQRKRKVYLFNTIPFLKILLRK